MPLGSTIAGRMDEEQLNRISGMVSGFVRANPGMCLTRSAEAGALVEHVHQRVPGMDRIPLCVASLACAFGARHAPPLELFNALSEIVARDAGADIDRIRDIVVAYGCGKWRRLRASADPWDGEGQWPGAFRALVEELLAPVREVNEWLSQHLVGYDELQGYWRTKEGEDDIRSDSARLAVHLTQPLKSLRLDEARGLTVISEDEGARIQLAGEHDGDWLPFGAKAVFEAQAMAVLRVRRHGAAEERSTLPAGTVVNVLAVEGGAKVRLSSLPTLLLAVGDLCSIAGTGAIARRACGCGNRNCVANHRLESWDPRRARVGLRSFLASAVKGPDTEIKTKTLVEGMYLPVLGKDGTGRGRRLRMVPVEYKLCSGTDCPSADPARKYEGDRCPSCRRAFDRRTTLRLAYERWIVVGGDVPPYERAARYRCTAEVKRNGRFEQCGNLYESETCPICGSEKAVRRPTMVWVRTFNKSESLDDPMGKRG